MSFGRCCDGMSLIACQMSKPTCVFVESKGTSFSEVVIRFVARRMRSSMASAERRWSRASSSSSVPPLLLAQHLIDEHRSIVLNRDTFKVLSKPAAAGFSCGRKLIREEHWRCTGRGSKNALERAKAPPSQGACIPGVFVILFNASKSD